MWLVKLNPDEARNLLSTALAELMVASPAPFRAWAEVTQTWAGIAVLPLGDCGQVTLFLQTSNSSSLKGGTVVPDDNS